MKSRKQRREDYKPRTHLIHGTFHTEKWDYTHHINPPMSASASFRLSSLQRGLNGFAKFGEEMAQQHPIYVYDRLDEPTRGMLEENLAYAEGGEIAVCYASGMAAISGVLSVLCERDTEIISHETVYGCTWSLMTNWLPRWGVNTVFANLLDPANVARAVTPRTRVAYFETPVNPTMGLIDIRAIRNEVDKLNAGRPEAEQIKVVVDNTFATPHCQRPLEHGAHFSVNSLTKDIGGFGTNVGGVVVGPRSYYHRLMLFRKDYGGVLSPQTAWNILVYGLPTLAARMTNQAKSAMRVAEFLSTHPQVDKVHYPGLESFPQARLAHRQMLSYDGSFAPGSMVYFTVKSDGDPLHTAERFIDYLASKSYCITLAVSLGNIKTLVEHPYSMTHSMMSHEERMRRGVHPAGIRLSLGLEDYHDILNDLKQALDACAEEEPQPVGQGAETR
jgi:cystathionine beta-lyase/cystathionine gamma-synthase